MSDGVYSIDIDGDNIEETSVYCDVDGDYVWTLIRSFSSAVGASTYSEQLSESGHEVNEETSDPSTVLDEYRLTYAQMVTLQDNSTYVRATCNFPIAYRPSRDYAVYEISSLTPLTNFGGRCLQDLRQDEHSRLRVRWWNGEVVPE